MTKRFQKTWRNLTSTRRRTAARNRILHNVRARSGLIEFAEPVGHLVLATEVSQTLEFPSAGGGNQHLFTRSRTSIETSARKAGHLSVISRGRLHQQSARLNSAAAHGQPLQQHALPSVERSLPLLSAQKPRLIGTLGGLSLQRAISLRLSQSPPADCAHPQQPLPGRPARRESAEHRRVNRTTCAAAPSEIGFCPIFSSLIVSPTIKTIAPLSSRSSRQTAGLSPHAISHPAAPARNSVSGGRMTRVDGSGRALCFGDRTVAKRFNRVHPIIQYARASPFQEETHPESRHVPRMCPRHIHLRSVRVYPT